MDALGFLSHLLCVVPFLLTLSAALNDSLTASQTLRDGETLVSSGGSFRLGFFSPGSSTGRYLGIWYHNIPVRTVVWVANRQNPVRDLSGLLVINSSGGLVLSNGTNGVVWSTGSVAAAQNPALQLLDTGNLVLRDGNTNIYLWQSFDYPSDTLLPGMKLGWDLRTSLNRHLSSWKSPDDPSPGELSNGIELDGYPQAVMMKGSRKFFRGGPWNGLRFSGAPELRTNPVFSFKFVANQEEVYYMYQLLNKSVITRLVMNETTSSRERYVWIEDNQSWRLYSSVPRDYCDNYDLCGANGICIISESPVCQCLKGFKPKSPQSWNSVDWSNGCIRDEPLNCSQKNGFAKISGIKLPDTVHSWVNATMSLKDCRVTCLRNCSCMAYTNSDISGRGHGCALWFGDLIDIRQFSDGGQDLYIRINDSDTENRALVIAAAVVVPFVVCVLLVLLYYFFRGRMINAKGKDQDAENEDMDLPFLQLATVARATDNFSVGTKLGEGGFGPVYKGLLIDGRHIAVKRLSKSSGQGLNEFANEVKLIAKLQHRNLVRLLGCCIEHNEKILVYEYMPNGSLDSFLFDQTKGSILNWSKRFGIICGIARGLVYLHQDSRLRIIHRDLKPSNVLLDNELNPKISDFGLARTFGGDQSEENTRRIVGTYGYMAPEYAVYGLFSAKSDVFSFGILVLEIMSGKKNIGSHHTKDFQNLIGYAWKLWTESRPLELLDSSLDDMLVETEMIRCIHVGLLCVQQSPEDRPTMSTVVVMLNGESTLPQPKQPGFLLDLIPSETGSSSCKNESGSVNDFSITKVMAR